jgi:hypothetical protein
MSLNSRVLVAMALLAFCGGTVEAQTPPTASSGRFQIVSLPKSANSTIDQVVILDTATGDLWQWIEAPAIGNNSGFNGIKYLGRVTPGAKPGDIVADAIRRQP